MVGRGLSGVHKSTEYEGPLFLPFSGPGTEVLGSLLVRSERRTGR